MLEIIEKFKPLINRKCRESHYDEDIKSELTLKLIQIIKELQLNNMRKINNYILLKYIKNSVYNHYIYLSKKNTTRKIVEESSNEFEELIFDLHTSQGSVYDAFLFEFLNSILTKREFKCIYYTVFMGYTSEEISKSLHISKQACNQCKLRGFKKIRTYYQEYNA